MKKTVLLNLPLLVIGLACGNQNKEGNHNQNLNELANYEANYAGTPEAPSGEPSEYGNAGFSNGNEYTDRKEKKGFFSGNSRVKGIKTHSFRDANSGLTVQTADYPADWQVISKPSYTPDNPFPSFAIQIQGPHNLKAFNTPLQMFVIYHNPQTNQYMAQFETSAKMMRPLPSNRQIIQDEVKNRMGNSGFQYKEDRQLPALENFLLQKTKQVTNDMNVDYTATIWENTTGTKAMVSVIKYYTHRQIGYNDGVTIWHYRLEYLFADAAYFEESVQHLQNATLNSQDNPKWNQYVQQINHQKMMASQQQFAQNQRNRQAAFDAHQQKMKGIWAAQDANHEAFMERSFGSGSDNSHQQFMNMIREEETVHNPLDENNYQIEAGASEYWMDSNGNYIKSDDLFYTPNGDINLNNREWVKVK